MELFDEEEQQVLINHQILYQKHSNEAHLMSAESKKKKKENSHEFDGI